MDKINLLFIVFIQIFNTIYCGKCPTIEVFDWCKCNTTTIVCNGNQDFDLKLYFKQLSEKLLKEDKNFDHFILNNTGIQELQNNTFIDITFKSIQLNNTISLKNIAFDVFSDPIMKTIERFEQKGKTLLGITRESATHLFFALSQLKIAQKITFDINQIKTIPDYSFGYTNSLRNNVTKMVFNERHDSRQHMQSIGNNALYNLNNLSHLNLSYNEINYIPVRAFDFLQTSDELLIIDLSDNYLNDSSIEKGAFTNSKRPLFIDLSHNNLSTLDHNIFEPILRVNKHNRISVENNPLKCDSKMDWILNNRIAYIYQIFDIKCNNYF